MSEANIFFIAKIYMGFLLNHIFHCLLYYVKFVGLKKKSEKTHILNTVMISFRAGKPTIQCHVLLGMLSVAALCHSLPFCVSLSH